MRAVNFAELNELSGELLPERTVLSSAPADPNNILAGLGGGNSGHATAYGSTSSCNANNTPAGSGGLLGLMGQAQQNSQVCTPASTFGSGG